MSALCWAELERDASASLRLPRRERKWTCTEAGKWFAVEMIVVPLGNGWAEFPATDRSTTATEEVMK